MQLDPQSVPARQSCGLLVEQAGTTYDSELDDLPDLLLAQQGKLPGDLNLTLVTADHSF